MQPEQSQLRAVIEESVRANLKKTLDSILGPITNLDLRDTQALRDIVERREGGSEKLQAALELFLKNLETSRSEFSTAAIQMNRALRASLHVLETSKDLQQFSIFAGVKAFTASDLKMGDVFQGYMNTSPLIDFWKEIVSFVVDHKIDKVDHASRAFQQRARTSAHPLHGQLLSFTGGAIAKWLDNVSRNLVEIDVKWTAAASNLLKSGVEIGEIIRITKQMREDLSGYLLHGTPAVQTVMAKMQGALKPYNEKIGDEQMRNDLSSAIVDTLESTRPLSPTLQNLKTRPLSSLTRIEGISLEEVILFVNYQLQITERGMALEYRRPDTLVMGSPRSGKAVAATFSNDEELLSTLKAAIVDIVADARAGVQRILDLAESASAVRQSVPPVLASPSWQQKLRDDFNLDSNLLEPTLAEIALGRTAMEVVIPGRSPKQFSTLRLSINELSTMGEMQFTARSGNGVLKEKRPAKLAIQVNELLGDASRREIEFTRLVDAFVLDEQNVGRKSAVVGAIFQTDQNPRPSCYLTVV
jgi:hypothetical protein